MDTSSTYAEQGEERWHIELWGLRGVLEAEGALAPGVGELLSIGLRLSSGGDVWFDARVCGLTTDASGRVSATVEFSELSVPERRAFERWQQLIARRSGSARVPATLAPATTIDAPSNWTQGSWRA